MKKEKSKTLIFITFVVIVFALILTTILALEVSNNVLSKFQYIDEYLQKSADSMKRDTLKSLKK